MILMSLVNEGNNKCLLLFSHHIVSNSFAAPYIVAHQAFLLMGFPGKNTGVGCHALPQRVFLTQGSNPHLETVRHHRYLRRSHKEHTLVGTQEL